MLYRPAARKLSSLSIFTIGVLLFIVTGCIRGRIPGDIALTSLASVDYHDQEQLPLPGSAASFAGIMGGHWLVRGAPGVRPHEPLLLAQFTSPTDLSRLAYSNTLGINSYLCDQPSEPVLLDLPYIFLLSHDVRLGPVPGLPDDEKMSPLTYSVYFRVTREASTTNTFPEKSFDLREKPADICFEIVGGQYRAFGYRSNTLRLTKEAVTAALGKYQADNSGKAE